MKISATARIVALEQTQDGKGVRGVASTKSGTAMNNALIRPLGVEFSSTLAEAKDLFVGQEIFVELKTKEEKV